MLGYLYNADRAFGFQAIPIAKGIAFALSGIPDHSVASAMTSSENPKEVEFIIEKYKSDAKTAQIMSGQRPGDE